MKNLLAFLLLTIPTFSIADDVRITMSDGSSYEDSVEKLLDTVSSACTDKNFQKYMDCFTPKMASTIRKGAEDTFICRDVTMDVLEHFVISSSEDSVSIGLKYICMDRTSSEKITYRSKIVLKRVGDSWKIDSEQVKNCSSSSPSSQSQLVAGCANGNCPIPGAQNNGGAPRPQDNGWRFPNPANGGEEAWLPRDILYKPGPSCANGKCGVR